MNTTRFQMYARTLYKALVSYECFGKDGWETVEVPLFVTAWNKDDAHTYAFKRTYKAGRLNIEVKSVKELSQAEYMRFIGAPELFAMAA